MDISRRTILKALGILPLFYASGGYPAMAEFFMKPKEKREPRLKENVFVKDGLALVGVSGSGGVKDMMREAVSLIGGLDRLDISGKTVFIKPNILSGEPHPTTTNPEAVKAAVELFYERGASKVFVGDMSAFATLSTRRNMKRCGIWRAAVDAGAEPVVFEDYGWVEVALPRNSFVKSAYVTEWLYRTDLFINLPVIKTHKSASYTITLKNFIGCTHLKQRPYFIDASRWEEIIAEFNAAYSPDLNIVDGTVSMVEGGPWSGTRRDTNLIMASGDRVGADIAGLGVIKSFGLWDKVAGKDVWDQKQIMTAIERNAGRDKDGLRLIASDGDEKFRALIKRVRELTGLKA